MLAAIQQLRPLLDFGEKMQKERAGAWPGATRSNFLGPNDIVHGIFLAKPSLVAGPTSRFSNVQSHRKAAGRRTREQGRSKADGIMTVSQYHSSSYKIRATPKLRVGNRIGLRYLVLIHRHTPVMEQ
jgi:hypothetical protein